MNIQLTFDDGHRLDLRFADILDKYNLSGVFYINSGLIGETEKERRPHPRWGDLLIRKEFDLIAKRHEIGGHTKEHPMCIRELSYEEQSEEIIEDKKILEGWIDSKITKFCYPRGRYDENTMKIVKEAGYKTARTVDLGFGYKNGNPYEQRCFQCAQRKEYNGIDWLSFCKERLNEAIRENKDITYFTHGFEIGADNEMGKFEELVKYITDKIDIIA